MKMPEYVAVKIMPDKKGTSYNLEVVTDADFVNVVRCKNCKHYIFDGDRFLCKVMSNNYEPIVCLGDEGFCSNGEKVTE